MSILDKKKKLESLINKNKSNLSREQSRMLFLKKLDEKYPINIVCCYEFSTLLNIEDLQLAISMAILKYPIFCYKFLEIEGVSIKIRATFPEVEIEMITQTENIFNIIQKNFYSGLDATQGKLIKFKISKLNDTKFYLIIIASKLVVDNKVLDQLAGDVADYYAHPGIDKSEKSNFLEANMLHLENSAINNDVKKIFWQKNLINLIDTVLLEDFQRADIKTHAQSSCLITFKKNLCKTLFHYSKKHNYTVNQILQAAFFILLNRYIQQDSICIGINHDLRKLLDHSKYLGPLDAMLPRRLYIYEDQTFSSVISRIKELDIYESLYTDFPLSCIVQALGIERNLDKTPLFQIGYHFQEMAKPIYESDKFMVKLIALPVGYSEYDIQLNVLLENDECHIRIDYNKNLYSSSFIQNLIKNFQNLLQNLMLNPDQSCQKAVILSDKESQKQLSILTTNEVKRDSKIRLEDLFTRQAKLTPNNIAVICGDHTITYAQLDIQSSQLAHYLSQQNLSKSIIIPILLDRSINSVKAIIAVLKAGYAFLTIDPDYPKERIQWMIENTGSEIILTESRYQLLFDLAKVKAITIENASNHKVMTFESRLIKQNHDIAYVIYTSGTTGKPKGTLLTHRGAVNNMLWRQETWPLDSNDKILMNSSFSFDPSIWGIFWPLSTGATTVITVASIKNDINQIVKLMLNEKITVIGTVPSFITLLMEHPKIRECKNLRIVLSGGEILSKNLLAKIHDLTAALVVNIFGPTENTIDASFHVCHKKSEYRVTPIGKAITNVKIYILDKYLNAVPQGVKGEIYIGGMGLAKGYLNDETLTQDKFIPNPYSTFATEKLYKTGDFGRINSAGILEYVERSDRQVKVRGYRIELSEIENILNQHPAILEAAVTADHQHNDCILNAYINLVLDATLDEETLRKYLSKKLPIYMIPNNYLIGINIPKNANQKIDYKKLPGIHKQINSLQHALESKLIDSIEKIVAGYFCDALSIKNIDKYADFFAAGGTSFMLTRLASNLYKHFNLDIPLYKFFKIPTVYAIAETIKQLNTMHHLDEVDKLNRYQLDQDALLDDDIYPASNIKQGDNINPSHVFLTGCTGYIGSFLLDQLMQQTSAIVYCLVRANSKNSALERIKTSMRFYRLWQDSYSNRIYPLVGDLSLPKLGVTISEWNTLADKVDIIYHNGAAVNFAYPYSALRAANVNSTKEILRLACISKLKLVNYVSTIDVLLAAHCARPFLENDAPLKTTADIPGGYTATKWVAEKIIRNAQARGIPTIIFRPSLVMGHTETGATQLTDYLLVSFKGFLPMKIMPQYPRIFDVVPVDYVAKSIVYISMQKNSVGKFFHLFNPRPTELNNFLNWTRSYGYEFKIVSFDEARKKALEVDSNHPLYPLVPLFRDADPTPQRSLDPNYINEVNTPIECKNVFEILANTNIACPFLDEKLVHLCMNYLVEAEFLPKPAKVSNFQ